MMLPFRISVQLSVLIAHAVWNYKQAGAVTSILVLNYRHIQIHSFHRSVYSHCKMFNKTWSKFRKAFFLFS